MMANFTLSTSEVDQDEVDENEEDPALILERKEKSLRGIGQGVDS